MSTRMTIRPQPIIGTLNGINSGVSGAMTANITSKVTILGSCTGAGFQINWTGTSPVGTVDFEVSNDYALNPNGSVFNAGTWTPMYILVNGTPAANIAVSGNTGTVFADITKTMAYAIRSVYTFTSGTGTMQAVITGKVS